VSAGTVAVLDGGALTSIQDVAGRRGFGRYGVTSGGACDPWSARLANRLVGNPDDAAVLESTLVGPSLRFDVTRPRAIAIAGADLGARLDGIAVRPGEPRVARPGSVLRCLGRVSGLRAHLAVAGGFTVERLLGSTATDLRSGFGGLDGRALRSGDGVSLNPTPTGQPARVGASAPAGGSRSIRVLDGPHLDRFAREAIGELCGRDWIVSEASDRTGLRLEGGAIPHGPRGAEVPSLGLPAGAIQVPADGRPIAMLSDHPVTGGYAVLGCVILADLGMAAQLAAGDACRFTQTTHDEAIEALRARWSELDRLEPIVPDRDQADWAGALD
jgi:biotin-dependent carboxylase-like uncharacterized protein